MQRLTSILILGLGAGLVAFLLVRNPASQSSDQHRSEQPTSGPSSARRSIQPTSSNPVSARSVEFESREKPSLTRHLPSRLDQSALSAQSSVELDALEQQEPDAKNFLDYKLGLLSRVRACMETKATIRGSVELMLHFDVDSEKHLAIGTVLEIRDSTLPTEADEQLLACTQQVHVDQMMSLHDLEPGQTRFYWATGLVFPTTDDPAYRWFQ